MIKEVVKFITEDNEEFTNLQDAQLHEYYLDVYKDAAKEFGWMAIDMNDVVKWFFNKFEKEYK